MTASGASVTRTGDHISLSWGGGDTVILTDYFTSSLARIEQINFSNGLSWTLVDIAQRQFGASGDDVFAGLRDEANFMRGQDGNDTLSGGDKTDQLEGGAGDDQLYGGGDADTLEGGTGADSLQGGADGDRFVFKSSLLSSNADTILDFSSAEGDAIALDTAVFGRLSGLVSMSSHFRLSSQAAQGADDFIVYDQSTGELFYDATGKGSSTAFLFATLSNQPADLTGAHFTVI